MSRDKTKERHLGVHLDDTNVDTFDMQNMKTMLTRIIKGENNDLVSVTNRAALYMSDVFVAATNPKNRAKTWLRYDLRTLHWSFIEEFEYIYMGPGARAARMSNGTILILGGKEMSNPESTECCTTDLQKNSFRCLGLLDTIREYAAVVGIPATNRVMIFGGFFRTIRSEILIYDHDKQSCDVISGVMIRKRAGASAVVIRNGLDVLIMGGEGDYGDDTKSSCEIYQSERDQCLLVASMNRDRKFHAACTLPNGNVFVTGGYADFGYMAQCETYNVGTDIWTAAPDMPVARGHHGCVFSHQHDSVVVFGGVNFNGKLDSCYAFSLQTRTWSRLEDVPIKIANFAYAQY